MLSLANIKVASGNTILRLVAIDKRSVYRLATACKD